ncbi:MAG: hypothetical protein K9G24_06750 [Candidatus Nanopelagicales bacterium]|nr:hypothetical protein [Candidatus Nanopelagicales bacterium]
MKIKSLMTVTIATAVALVLTGCGTSTPDDTSSAGQAGAPGEAIRSAAESESSGFAITNDTDKPITISITETDNFDWESRRPDHPAPEGFQGQVIAPDQTITRWLTRNTNAIGAPFRINFGDTGASARFYIRQDEDTKETDTMPPYLDTYRWGGWNAEGSRYCEKMTTRAGGYTITSECTAFGINQFNANSMVTISD